MGHFRLLSVVTGEVRTDHDPLFGVCLCLFTRQGRAGSPDGGLASQRVEASRESANSILRVKAVSKSYDLSVAQ